MDYPMALGEFSNDSDSDTEMTNFLIMEDDKGFWELCQPRVPRVQNFIETAVENYNDEQFQENFR